MPEVSFCHHRKASAAIFCFHSQKKYCILLFKINVWKQHMAFKINVLNFRYALRSRHMASMTSALAGSAFASPTYPTNPASVFKKRINTCFKENIEKSKCLLNRIHVCYMLQIISKSYLEQRIQRARDSIPLLWQQTPLTRCVTRM